MTTFVLLHGGGMGGWVWKYVAEPLRNAGHTVYTPTFTGFGERIHLISRAVTPATNITDTLNLFDCEELDDVVLVAHSYAGVIAPGVQQAIPGRIKRVVYVDAIVPEQGEPAAVAMGFMPPEQAADMAAMLARDEGPVGAGVPEQVRAMADVEPQRMSADRDQWVFRHLTDMPLRCMVEPIAVGARQISCAVDYLSVDHTMMQPMHQRASALGWNLHHLDGDYDHMVHVGAPQLVVKHLL